MLKCLYSALFENTVGGDHLLVLCTGATPELAMRDAIFLFEPAERENLTGIGIFAGAMVNVQSGFQRRHRMRCHVTAAAFELDLQNALPLMENWEQAAKNRFSAAIAAPGMEAVHTIEITHSLGSWWLLDSTKPVEQDYLLLEQAIMAGNESLERTRAEIDTLKQERVEQRVPEYA